MIGKTLAHYRILDRLGSGGMAEVFLAEDTRLHREVALKILPAEVARHPERLERFEREARSLAALNHPNVVTIHAVEEAEGVRFLVMERVVGKPLNTLITAGGLPLDRLLELAIPIADALAVAHERGVIHRDLKPSNVMVTPDGRVKVIDFGLAKLFTEDPRSSSQDAVTAPLTVEGRILGTPGYMAPEQVEGGAVDARTDLFSLGVMLYEMATGRRPFTGGSHVSVLSAILRDAPPLVTEINPELPQELARIIRHCLEKDPRERFQTALDLRNELKSLRTDWQSGAITPVSRSGSMPRPTGLNAPGPGRVAGPSARKLVVAGAGVGVLVLLALFAPWRRGGTGSPTSPAPAEAAASAPSLLGRLQVRPLTAGQRIGEWPAWAPDSRRVVYAASDGQFQQLYVRDLEGGGNPEQITSGPHDHIQPTWSPTRDEVVYVRSREANEHLDPSDAVFGFYAHGGDLYRLDLKTRQEVLVVQDGYYPLFSRDGDWLIFSAPVGGTTRLVRTDRQGNRLSQLSQDESDQFVHVEASLDPAGRRLAYRRTDTRNANQLVILDLQTRASTNITGLGWNFSPAWDADGKFLYFASYGGAAVNLFRVLVGPDNQAVGKIQPVTGGAGYDLHPALSPDGRRLAYCIRHPNSDLWRIPLDPTTGKRTGDLVRLPEPINTGREDSRAAWSPDAHAIAFNSDRDGPMNIYLHRFADPEIVQRVTTGPGGDFQPHWSPDGRRLAFFSSRDGTSDIWLVDTNGQNLVNLTKDSPAHELNPFFSPDGRHIAFTSDRTGATEFYLMDADGQNVRQLTTERTGGHYTPWYSTHEVLVPTGIGGVRGYYLLSSTGAPPRRLFPGPTPFGAHGSFSPQSKWLLDLDNHRHLFVAKPFELTWEDIYNETAPQTRIDYPVWSPRGDAAIIARYRVEGAEIWLAEGLKGE